MIIVAICSCSMLMLDISGVAVGVCDFILLGVEALRVGFVGHEEDQAKESQDCYKDGNEGCCGFHIELVLIKQG
jgi:hypothetical protein